MGKGLVFRGVTALVGAARHASWVRLLCSRLCVWQGVQELHRLRLRFPDFDLEGVLRHRPSRLRDLVRARLAELDGRPPGSNVAHVLPLPQGDSNRRRGTSRGSAFRLPADLSRWGPKEWLARTRAILDYGGFDGGCVDLCPHLGARPDPEEPLETTRARHARLVRESEDMAARVVRLLEGQE
ncbi:unnamed protein product [Ixodes pacificus]